MSGYLPDGCTDRMVDEAIGYWEPDDEACDECGHTFGKTDATVAYRGKLLCVDCVPTHCTKCDQVIYISDTKVMIDNEPYHEQCAEARA